MGGGGGQSFEFLHFDLVIAVFFSLAIALEVALHPCPIVLAVESGEHDLLLWVCSFLLAICVLLFLCSDQLFIEILDFLLVLFDLVLHFGVHHFQLFQLPHFFCLLLFESALQVFLIGLQFLVFLSESLVVHFEQFYLISVLVEDVLVFIVFLDYLCIVQIF